MFLNGEDMKDKYINVTKDDVEEARRKALPLILEHGWYSDEAQKALSEFGVLNAEYLKKEIKSE